MIRLMLLALLCLHLFDINLAKPFLIFGLQNVARPFFIDEA